jgi:hypothetical protein
MRFPAATAFVVGDVTQRAIFCTANTISGRTEHAMYCRQPTRDLKGKLLASPPSTFSRVTGVFNIRHWVMLNFFSALSIADSHEKETFRAFRS